MLASRAAQAPTGWENPRHFFDENHLHEGPSLTVVQPTHGLVAISHDGGNSSRKDHVILPP